jgi:hypothetical protein
MLARRKVAATWGASPGDIDGEVLEKLGGRTRARTWDPMIKSPVLTLVYQRLSRKFCGFGV